MNPRTRFVPRGLGSRPSWALLAALALVALVVGALGSARDSAQATGGNSITTPDAAGFVGHYTSLALDAAGNPVVSYYDSSNADLKVLHCNDANCAGGDEGIEAPDTSGNVGQYTSLALDVSGFPVVTYRDASNGDLRLLHCNDPNCSGGDESIASPQTTGDVGWFTSLSLDASGFPVVTYHDSTNGDVKLLHCNDANCSGGDDSIVTLHHGGGSDTSLALDASGFPVAAYVNQSLLDLVVVHCNDPACTGDNESVFLLDISGSGSSGYTSLVLDASGFPVVNYKDGFDLKLLHCADPNCAGGGESIVFLSAVGVGGYNSLALDDSGFPVVSFHVDDTNLSVLHCSDVNCAGGNESIAVVDGPDNVGLFTSLVLDASGSPVVSYCTREGGYSSCVGLKLLHCGDPTCEPKPMGTATTTPTTTGTPTRTPTPTTTPCGSQGCPPPGMSLSAPSNVAVNETFTVTINADPPPAVGVAGFATEVVVPSGLEWLPRATCILEAQVSVNGFAPARCDRQLGPNSQIRHVVSTAIAVPPLPAFDTPLGDLVALDLRCNTAGSYKLTLTAVPQSPFGATYFGQDTSVILVATVSEGGNQVADTAFVSCDDADADGCPDQQETGPNETLGGRRDPTNFWDFYDVPTGTFPSLARDRMVTGSDFFAVLGRFGATGTATGVTDALAPPPDAPAYHASYDRGPPSGPYRWDLTQADGAIAGTDFFAVLVQFGHSCA